MPSLSLMSNPRSAACGLAKPSRRYEIVALTVSLSRKRHSADLLAAAAAFDEAFDDAAAQLARMTVYRKAAADTSHLLDEVHQAGVEVVLDEGEGAELDASADAGGDFLQRVPGGAL